MIKELIEQKGKYFWSKSKIGTIIIGGHNNGRFYGQIELTIDKNSSVIKIDVSNGVSSSIKLTDRTYSNLTQEYKQIKELYDGIDDYLDEPNIKLNQEMDRETLLQNVMDLLPKYADVE